MEDDWFQRERHEPGERGEGHSKKKGQPWKYEQFEMSEEMTFISLLLKYKVQAVEKAVVAEVSHQGLSLRTWMPASCTVSQAAADESINKGTRGEEAHTSSIMEKISAGG